MRNALRMADIPLVFEGDNWTTVNVDRIHAVMTNKKALLVSNQYGNRATFIQRNQREDADSYSFKVTLHKSDGRAIYVAFVDCIGSDSVSYTAIGNYSTFPTPPLIHSGKVDVATRPYLYPLVVTRSRQPALNESELKNAPLACFTTHEMECMSALHTHFNDHAHDVADAKRVISSLYTSVIRALRPFSRTDNNVTVGVDNTSNGDGLLFNIVGTGISLRVDVESGGVTWRDGSTTIYILADVDHVSEKRLGSWR